MTSYGASPGPESDAALIRDLHPTNIRTYQPAQTTTAPHSMAQIMSRKIIVANTIDKLKLATFLGDCKNLPDIPGVDGLGHMVSGAHEDNIAAGATPDVWQTLWNHYIIPGVDGINQERKHPLIPVPILTASVFTRPGGMVPWDIKDCKTLGWDCYNPNLVPVLSHYASGSHRPYILAEIGTPLTNPRHRWTDEEYRDCMATFLNLTRRNPGKLLRMDWFNGETSTITNGDTPSAEQYWREVCQGKH